MSKKGTLVDIIFVCEKKIYNMTMLVWTIILILGDFTKLRSDKVPIRYIKIKKKTKRE